MEHPETHLVTKENGPRPRGRDDECFYCHHAIGTEHAKTCVCRKRTIMVRVEIDMAYDVPEHWDKDMIDFHFGDSSWCADNIVERLQKLQNAGHTCLCSFANFKLYGEATSQNDKDWGLEDLSS